MLSIREDCPMQSDLLLWLAESNRDFNLAGPGFPKAAAGASQVPQPWLWGITFEDRPLPYEPRCLARSPNGKLLAVGTKAGVLHIERKDGDLWNHFETIPAASRRSIRAVRFLDDSTVVAGWGEGLFGVFAVVDDRLERIYQSPDQAPTGSGNVGAFRARRWLDRFARIISLVPPGATQQPGHAVMLGLTVGSHVHVLSRTPEGYEARTLAPREVFPEVPEGARITDGVWSHQRLWLLDSAGSIYCYSPDEPAAANARARVQAVTMDLAARPADRRSDVGRALKTLTPPRRSGEFRAIAACVMGLAVLASDHVTFLRFKMEGDKDEPRLDLRSPLWVEVPRAIDCSVCLPFSDYYDPEALASQRIRSEDPVWTVVSTAQPGLRWIGWYDNPSSRFGLTTVSLAQRGGDSSVLQVRFGFEDRDGPTYIAYATRNHHLRIATILDRRKTAAQLAAAIPEALHAEPPDPRLESHRGIAWWRAWQRVLDDFTSLPPSNKAGERRQLLRLAERDDLFRLVQLVLKEWRDSPLKPERKLNLLREWIHHILARAYHVEETLAMELAKVAHDQIVRLASGDAKGKSLETYLRPLAAFLRKWVVFGHTYGDKALGLLQLFDWNHASGHHLDGLVYLTKLLRRRVDPVWEARPPAGLPSAGIWDLAAPPDGRFSVHSCGDGGIAAVDSKGGSLEWLPPPGAGDMETGHQLQIWQGRLRHRLAEDFLTKYRQGPSARALALSATASGEGSPHLLLFCTRGFRPEDQDGYPPRDSDARLFAVLAAPLESAKAMRILAIASQPLPADLYGLCELRHLSECGRRHVFLAGTKGAWQIGGGWKARPFIELAVEIGADGRELSILLNHQVEVLSDPRGVRSAFTQDDVRPEAAHNPCWSLAIYTSRAGEPWLCAGFHDGRIRCYLRQAGRDGSWCWTEGGNWEEEAAAGRTDPFGHRVHGLATSASVWRLHVLQEQRLLAYGTSDGVIGAFPLEAPVAEEASDPASANPSGASGDPATKRPHLVHYRESSPICGLLSYREPGGETRLLAMTQGGVIVLVDLDPANRDSVAVSKFHFQGLLLDRFALGHEARAAAIVPHAEEPHLSRLGAALPAVLVGTKEGSVFKHVLAFPRGSERRSKAFNQWCDELYSNTGTGEFVGKDVYSWLRILDVRGVHLLRFSIAHDLRHSWADLDPTKLERYITHLNELADDVYGRRPLTPEPAKIIWEEAARAANLMARRALALSNEDEAEREALLTGFLELNKVVDDLCNRWSGSEQSVESRVLMYTFNCLFGWAGVVIIGLAQPSQAALATRRFLLHNLIQRRLSFNDRLVQFETLRHLNVGLMRALRHQRAMASGPPAELSLRPRPGGSAHAGLHDLLTMVGDLGERHTGSLTPADPLWTELARFFAACLLLLPTASFVISQVVSESRLTERDTRFTGAVEAHAEAMLHQLAIDRTSVEKRALRQFADSFADSIDASLAHPSYHPRGSADPVVGTPARQTDSAWRRLLDEAERVKRAAPPGDYDDYSNEAFLLDHAAAIRTAADLISLSTSDALPQSAQDWLAPSTPSRYFRHSQAYLRHLQQTWQQVRQVGRGTGQGRRRASLSIRGALDLCDAELKYLATGADLFEPQRRQYIAIVELWRDQLQNRATEAVDLLDTLDRFNRHTYRASSDRLMSTITELALQTAPLWLDRSGSRPLRSEMLERLKAHPLVRAIFDNGTRLVASTHLAGTVFTVARATIDGSGPAAHQTTLKEINEGLVKFCDFEEVGLRPMRTLPDEVSAPGTVAVWDTVLQEVVVNTRNHCPRRPLLFVSYEEEGSGARLAFASGEPFLHTLQDEHRERVGAFSSAQERFKELHRLAQLTTAPGERLAASDPTGSSGMGLTLILKVCSYLGMRPEIRLRNLEDAFSGDWREVAGEERAEKALSWPFCLHLEWDRQI